MRVKVEAVPRQTWRRVARHLESVRSAAEPGDGAALRLGDTVCPIHRPDLECVAYWEFEVHGAKATGARDHDGRSSDTGFILATAGRHDLPIPHWSLATEPPSRALESKAGHTPHRIVKLDTLSYAAEDAKGQLIAHVGSMPTRIDEVRDEHRKEIAIASARPVSPCDDRQPPKLHRTSTGSPPPRLSGWPSWTELRHGYARAYRPQLSALAKRAAAAWDIEDLVAEFGEGIREGESVIVPLLRPAKVSLTGDGARVVEIDCHGGRELAVTLRAGKVAPGSPEIELALEIVYETLEPETLVFFVVPNAAPSDHRSALPHAAGFAGGRP
jgi:hypothetical protein